MARVNQVTNKRILESEVDSEVVTDTQIIQMPSKHFHILIENKNSLNKNLFNETVELSAKLKGEEEEKKLYIEAYNKEKKERELTMQKCNMIEKELSIHKSRIKTAPEIERMLSNTQKNDEYIIKNKDKLVGEYYNKNYLPKTEALKKSLGL